MVKSWGPSGSGEWYVAKWGPIPANSWFLIEGPVSDGTPINRIAIELNPSSNWTGAMYVDDVAITPAL